MGLDHINEPLLGRLSSRLVLVVSDLVSDLDVLAVSSIGLTGPILLLGWMVLLIGAFPIDPVRLSFDLVRWSFVACSS